MRIKENILEIQSKIDNINPQARLLIVVKNRNIDEINECLKYCNIIGINRWQEFKNKFFDIKNIQFHFIGHLQKNKVKNVIKYFDCIQSVDSLELAEKINAECQKINKKINIFLQINISNDPNKFGFKLGEIKNILEKIISLKNILLIGFMTITAEETEEKIREDYQKMKKLFDENKEQYHLIELSMGMSDDYLIALEEGATMVRVGSAIFD